MTMTDDELAPPPAAEDPKFVPLYASVESVMNDRAPSPAAAADGNEEKTCGVVLSLGDST